MTSSELEKKKMPLATMLAKVADVLEHGARTDPPAYTLILGAGASFGVVPTAKEMLGLPDGKTGKVHEDCIPVWRAHQHSPNQELNDDASRLLCSKRFWETFVKGNPDRTVLLGSDGLPDTKTIAAAYKTVFDTMVIGGLDTPERHREYLSAVTLPRGGRAIRLNATHFYLASLLALQERSGEEGSSKQPLYTGHRPFVRTLFTTNFDPLLQTSLQLFQLLYYMTDRPEHLSADALQTDRHQAIHLFYAHGSVHRPYLANSDHQIDLLKKRNARDLAAYLGTHGVIVLGYSGWDDCLLEALNQTQTFANNLYWLARGPESLTDPVKEFLATHPNAYWVPIDDGGSFMAQLHSRLCPGAPNTEILYNPISPLLRQLDCVDLTGIQTGVQHIALEDDKDSLQVPPPSESPLDVEQIRLQVLALLKDAQQIFLRSSVTSNSLEELERQADLSYANKDWDASWEAYNRVLTLGPDLPVESKARSLLRRGYCYGRKGQDDKAIEDFTAVIELSGAPTDSVASARVSRGHRYSSAGQRDKAIEDYSAVIEMPGAPAASVSTARASRGNRYAEEGHRDKSIKDYNAVLGIEGAVPGAITTALIGRGNRSAEADQHEKAIGDYSIVVDMPDAPASSVGIAYFNRGLEYSKTAQQHKAIADYTAVIGMPDQNLEILALSRLNRGLLYFEAGEQDKALEDYSAAINIPGAPSEAVADALFYRGNYYSNLDKLDKAVEDYTAVINLPGAPKGTATKAISARAAIKRSRAKRAR